MRRLTIGVVALCAIALLAYVTLAQPGRGRFGRSQHPVVTALDADRNGEISAAEIAGAAEALKKLDKNKDGKLAREEMRPTVRPGGRRPGLTAESFGSSPMPKTDAEKKILAVLQDMYDHQRRGMMNVPPDDGRMLRLLTEATGAKHVVEIGTSNGYSGIWLCLALRGTGGKLTTYEIDARRAALARENFKRAGVDKIVTLVEGDAHKEVPKLTEPIDLIFLDADKQGYLDYLNKLLPLLRPGGLVVAHNMTTRQADPRYLKAITTNPALESLFVNMRGGGIGVTLKRR